MTGPQITPWVGDSLPTIADIETVMVTEGLRPGRWGNGPKYLYHWHRHATDKVLYCSSGSIIFHFEDGVAVDDIAMEAGDRLDLPAGTAHAATVGPKGVRCVEAMRKPPSKVVVS